jgi:hypothetical protein
MLAKSPNRQAAVAYLAACNATAITIVDRDGIGVIIVGKTAKGTVAARWWIATQDAQRVAAQARRCAGESPDIATAIAAVQRSAALVALDDCGIEFHRRERWRRGSPFNC